MKVNIMTKITTPAEANPVVITANVIAFVDQYKVSVRKTAESILELANVVYNAENALSKVDFTCFREQIGADKSKDSYIKKLRVIAKASARLNEFRGSLPASYTTLYTLSSLSEEIFTQVVADDVINPQMTANALSKYIVTDSTPNDCLVTLNLKSLKDFEKNRALLAIESVCEKFKIELKSKLKVQVPVEIKQLSDRGAVAVIAGEMNDELEIA